MASTGLFQLLVYCFLTVHAAGYPGLLSQSLPDVLKVSSHNSSQSNCQIKSSCGVCGKPVNIVITAKNILQGSNFEMSASITNEPQGALLFFLEKAATLVTGFKFTSTYYAGLGYFIDSINGIQSSVQDKTFWHISSGGVALTCGASSYVPEDGEKLLFNFTTYRDAGYE
ncbi:hypothetical protein Btru_012222 [Bulinus truncatus]|nr:hypothetical protein Btru_012222 [Bulinus truncatus]